MSKKLLYIKCFYVLLGIFAVSLIAEPSSNEDNGYIRSKSLRIVPVKTLTATSTSGSSQEADSGNQAIPASDQKTLSEPLPSQSKPSVSSKQSSTIPATREVTKTEGLITLEGVITAIEPEKTSPTIQILLSNRKAWAIAVEPAKSSMMRQGRPVSLEDLEVGDKVRVAYTPTGGLRLLRTLEVLEIAVAPGSK